MCLRHSVLLILIGFAMITTALSASKIPQVLAHRGASGHAPETTLASYRLAIQMKVDFLELDVHMTRDGEIVAIHDTLVDRTTDGMGPVGDMTLAQLKKLDAGSWFNKAFPAKARPEFGGQRIPTLQEIIELARDGSVGLYIETKNPELYPADFETKLLDVLRRNRFESRALIQSFDARSVEKVKALNPAVRTALLVEKASGDPVEGTLKARADELAIDYKILTRDIANRAHEKGLSVTVWTVNDDKEMRRMVGMGVDRIITDYPDRLNRLLGK